ncbi:cupin [Tamilnaduibacter salinus]|uniref:Cupin n=1 Tax=Tamilnaduibacter salinus TaxID=1484056 RepID=A0A2A2HYV8_9GAMM|nr:cupin domain-containing protein [Tamilnaduibacter salinus]PAV24731.1 cupin [Tamilnaduibacter salinus]
MDTNADFSQPTLVHAEQEPWVASPMPGVERRILDRLGGEVARATSIVRYAPKSAFSPHTHGGGEEFVVLEGTFEDEYGQFPAGTYVRNPPTSRHTPGSTEGCTIFVKLWQFDPDDRLQFHIDMRANLQATDSGLSEALLHESVGERVTYTEAEPNSRVTLPPSNGIEILVLSGSLIAETQTLERYSWLRLPPGEGYQGTAGESGARFWMKTGHLDKVQRPPE